MPSSRSSLPALTGVMERSGLRRFRLSVGVPRSAFPPQALQPEASRAPKNVVIVVHGTGSRHSPYMKLGSEQMKVIQSHFPNAQVEPFYWSGDLSVTDRKRAGKHLAQVIKMFLGRGAQVEAVIAHSHGCNVFNEATQYLAASSVKAFIAIAGPARPEHPSNGPGRAGTQVIPVQGDRDVVKPLGEFSPAAPLSTAAQVLRGLVSVARQAFRPGAPPGPFGVATVVTVERASHRALVHHGGTLARALTQALGPPRAAAPQVGHTTVRKIPSAQL